MFVISSAHFNMNLVLCGCLQPADRTQHPQLHSCQPHGGGHVAEVFSSIPGAYVPVSETVRGFKEILAGKLDMVPEDAFFMRGGIDDAVSYTHLDV